MSQKTLNKDSFITIYLILKILRTNPYVTKTRLMFLLFTSNSLVKNYIKKVLDLGLVRSESTEKDYPIYKLTEKGEYLYIKMQSMIELLPHQFAKDFDQP